MEFKWAKIHKNERDVLVGSDDFDLSLNKDGIPQILSPYILIARQRARQWLPKQQDADLIFFSFDRTLSIYVQNYYVKPIDDQEADAFNDLTQRHGCILEAWNRKLNKEYLKISEGEAKAAWEKIERLYSSVYGKVSDE